MPIGKSSWRLSNLEEIKKKIVLDLIDAIYDHFVCYIINDYLKLLHAIIILAVCHIFIS